MVLLYWFCCWVLGFAVKVPRLMYIHVHVTEEVSVQTVRKLWNCWKFQESIPIVVCVLKAKILLRDLLRSKSKVCLKVREVWLVGYVQMYMYFNLFTSGHIIFFSVPRAGLFSVKIRKKILAIKNETMSGQPINTSFIDISRIKWLVLLLRSSFFCTTSTVASSEAQPIISPHPVKTSKTMDINPSLQICG